MTVSYNQATINLRLTDVLNQISTGAIQVLDASGNVLVSFPNTSLSVAGGVLSFGSVSAVIARAGVAASAQITGLGGVPVTGLTVSSSPGSDIVMPTSLTLGQNVTLTSGAITGR